MKKECMEQSNNMPTVVVTGRNYCNILTMARAFGKAGYNVKVLRIYKKKPRALNLLARMEPDKDSKYVSAFRECIVNDNIQRIIDSLLEMAPKGEKALVFPVDDYSCHAVDENMDALESRYFVPGIEGRQGGIVELMDKDRQKRLAKDFDIPMLESTVIKSEDGSFTIPDDIIYPCFIKPNVSMKSTKSTMTKCENRDELESALEKCGQKGGFEMLVEEYAEIKQEYSLLGMNTHGGITAPGLFRVIEGGHKERKGVALIGETVDTKPFQELIDKCSRFIRSLNFMGMFDVDFIETTDGKVYFVELNFRAGASTHVLTELGINLPGSFADQVLQQKDFDAGECKPEYGRRFISEKILIEEFARDDVDVSGVRDRMKKADICFIRDDDDPKPYNTFKKYYFVAAMMRVLFKIKSGSK